MPVVARLRRLQAIPLSHAGVAWALQPEPTPAGPSPATLLTSTLPITARAPLPQDVTDMHARYMSRYRPVRAGRSILPVSRSHPPRLFE